MFSKFSKLFIIISCLSVSVAALESFDVDNCYDESKVGNYPTNLLNFTKRNEEIFASGTKVKFCDLHQMFMAEITKLDSKNTRLNSNCILNKFYNFACINSNHLIWSDEGISFCKAYTPEKFNQKNTQKQSSGLIWLYGIISVTIISSCSLLGISVLPCIDKPVYNKVLLFLICLSVGTLSGNATFQLIPKGFEVHSPKIVWQSVIVSIGIYLFFLTENFLENFFKTRHSHEPISNYMSSDFLKGKNLNDCSGKDCPNDALIKTDSSSTTLGVSDSQNSKTGIVSIEIKNNKSKNSMFNFKKVKPIAWMITIADGLHNFIDGMAIGASFVVSPIQGLSTSIAIFCEELPHELGDFAILLNAGMTIRQAAFFNFASACGCYIGLVVGILVGQSLSSATWIFALVGGVFLYISLAGMLPEARAHSMNSDLITRPWLCFIIQNIGLLTGFLAMFLLTYFEDSLDLTKKW